VTTSTVRFAVIVALVIVGAVVIAQFPTSGSNLAGASTSPTPSSSPSGTGQNGNNGNSGNGGQQSGTDVLTGVKVAVYNGTTQTGLAADVAAALVKRYDVKISPKTSILNAPSIPVDLTAVYFVTPADKAAATTLADEYFKKLPSPPKVQKLPANTTAPAGVQVAVYLGTDYVNG
jgi:LytR cell envelope-related transcriptional attenuator